MTHPPRSPLGREYGDHLLRDRLAGDPLAGLRDSPALVNAYGDQFLAAPAFLSEAERRGVTADLLRLYGILRSVPERIFDGDHAALARSVGMNAVQTALVTRAARTGRLLPLGRADLYHDGAKFTLLELNVTSALGGFDNTDMNRALLAYPPLREFVARHGLRHGDTVAAMVKTLLAECSEMIPDDRPPTVAVVDTEENFRIIGHVLGDLGAKMRDYGVDALACHLGEITYPAGRPVVRGRAVDVVLRYFLIEDMVEPAAAARLEPLLDAVERGVVGMASRFDAELYSNKGIL